MTLRLRVVSRCRWRKQSPEQGFLNRNPQNAVRSSATNRAISIRIFNLREKFQISLKILWKFSLGNRQYRSSVPAQSTVSLFSFGHFVLRIIFSSIYSASIDRGFTMEEWLASADLECSREYAEHRDTCKQVVLELGELNWGVTFPNFFRKVKENVGFDKILRLRVVSFLASNSRIDLK